MLMISYHICRGAGVVLVKLGEVVEGEEGAHHVDEDPQQVQDVVSTVQRIMSQLCGVGYLHITKCEVWAVICCVLNHTHVH